MPWPRLRQEVSGFYRYVSSKPKPKSRSMSMSMSKPMSRLSLGLGLGLVEVWLKFSHYLLYTVGVLCHVEWCIRLDSSGVLLS